MADMIDRRQMIKLLTSALGVSFLPGHVLAREDGNNFDELIKKITGGKEQDGQINLQMPEIAENGNTVPVSVSAQSPMTSDNYVKSIALFSDGNPRAEVAVFHFTPQSGKAEAATRMRLLKSSNVYAVAALSDGSFYKVKRAVKVTIGGCGG